MDMGAALAASRDAAFMAGGASFNPTPESGRPRTPPRAAAARKVRRALATSGGLVDTRVHACGGRVKGDRGGEADLGLVGLGGRVAAPALGVPEHGAVEGEAVGVHLGGPRRRGRRRAVGAVVPGEPAGDRGRAARGAPDHDLPLASRHRRHRPRAERAAKKTRTEQAPLEMLTRCQ